MGSLKEFCNSRSVFLFSVLRNQKNGNPSFVSYLCNLPVSFDELQFAETSKESDYDIPVEDI